MLFVLFVNGPSARKAGMEPVVQPHFGDCLFCEKAGLGFGSKGGAQKTGTLRRNRKGKSVKQRAWALLFLLSILCVLRDLCG
jgi:hypothetical protein